MEYFTLFIIFSILALVFYVLAKNVKQSKYKLKEFLITTAFFIPAFIACRGWLLFIVICIAIASYGMLYRSWTIGLPEDIMRDDD